MKYSKRFSSVLSQGSGTLPQLFNRGRELQRLENLVRGALPATLQGHCRLANVRQNTLVLQADSPVWGARLRYAAPALLRELRRAAANLPPLQRIEVLVRPTEAASTALPPSRRHLGEHTAALLDEVAAGTEDPGLRQAWERLARRARHGSRNEHS